MSKLKLQYFGHLMRGADSLEADSLETREKTLMLGKIEGGRILRMKERKEKKRLLPNVNISSSSKQIICKEGTGTQVIGKKQSERSN